MLNLGGNHAEIHWPDDWTVTTVDGKRSAQFEETLLYVPIPSAQGGLRLTWGVLLGSQRTA